jgi:hypothetical protein
VLQYLVIFSTELNRSAILVNSVIHHATVLNHFSLSYSVQRFFAIMNSIIFATLFNYFMILSTILEIMSVICYNTQPFYKIAQSFSKFHRSFSRMTYEGASARARVQLDRGHATRSGWLVARSVGRTRPSHTGGRVGVRKIKYLTVG